MLVEILYLLGKVNVKKLCITFNTTCSPVSLKREKNAQHCLLLVHVSPWDQTLLAPLHDIQTPPVSETIHSPAVYNTHNVSVDLEASAHIHSKVGLSHPGSLKAE